MPRPDICITIPGEPHAQGRQRVRVVRTKAGRTIAHQYQPAESRNWKATAQARDASGHFCAQVSNAVLTEAYNRLGSVWKTAREVGLCGQSVHERVRRLGINRRIRVFTEAEREVLRVEYPDARRQGKLHDLAARMRRTKPFICRQARVLGLTSRGGSSYTRDGHAISARVKQWHASHEHPRGMLGMKHTLETRQKLSHSSRRYWESLTEEDRAGLIVKQLRGRMDKYGTLVRPRSGVTWKGGWRVMDDGQRLYFRSRWEYNYGVYLQFLVRQKQIHSWTHEPKIFWFEAIKRGCRSYLPDFCVVNLDGSEEYHEVKGWMDSRSKTKLRRMAKYHPTVKLLVIDGTWFKVNGPRLSWLPGWESSQSKRRR